MGVVPRGQKSPIQELGTGFSRRTIFPNWGIGLGRWGGGIYGNCFNWANGLFQESLDSCLGGTCFKRSENRCKFLTRSAGLSLDGTRHFIARGMSQTYR